MKVLLFKQLQLQLIELKGCVEVLTLALYAAHMRLLGFRDESAVPVASSLGQFAKRRLPIL